MIGFQCCQSSLQYCSFTWINTAVLYLIISGFSIPHGHLFFFFFFLTGSISFPQIKKPENSNKRSCRGKNVAKVLQESQNYIAYNCKVTLFHISKHLIRVVSRESSSNGCTNLLWRTLWLTLSPVSRKQFRFVWQGLLHSLWVRPFSQQSRKQRG